MKSLLIFLCFIVPYLIYKYYFHQPHLRPQSEPEPEPEPEPENLSQENPPNLKKIMLCKEASRNRSDSSPLNYLGPSLVSNSSDSEDLLLCPGDAFGDLNDTYIVVKDCYLVMYHQHKIIWSSSKVKPWYRFLEGEGYCAFSVQKDGNLALYLRGSIISFPGGRSHVANLIWDSQTYLNPLQTEVKLYHQQVQIIQAFENGTQRLFYADKDHQGFKEDLGEPVKRADKLIIKDHRDEDKTILKRNEYIGDLNETHLILQSTCDLQLLNKNKVIWSFGAPFRYEANCVLNIQNQGHVAISKGIAHEEETPSDWKSIIVKPKDNSDYQGVSSRISFEGDLLTIIQTLNNGSEITYYSGPGMDIILKPKKALRQIAENTIAVSREGLKEFSMERMDYIGNLTGLHLILEQNCSLVLANGNQTLWEFKEERFLPKMDCSFIINHNGLISLKEKKGGAFRGEKRMLRRVFESERGLITAVQLTLKDNKLVITRERSDRGPEIYHAGLNAQFIAEDFLILKPEDLDLPKMGYIGDMNSIHLVFENNCKWVLYNKAKVIWESGRNLSDENDGCMMVIKEDGDVILTDQVSDKNWVIWSTMEVPLGMKAYKKGMVMKLSVNQDGLEMVHTFTDGTVNQYKALEGTNSFSLLLNEYKEFYNFDL